ncbi:AraC family transcriptional regulator [Paenibacillus mendelii]|uniref:AraC family transcriptional regulator n=1 Tax=Paenibacillus mendelii TaxID=206163 RepID=A0ABV6J7Q0_9BACL|nr:AraC family transcriptional regulator [Paenibacillus mendelii]MCQ6561141.1 AraC family transcriptional regulator [Paenibacillus mendelii]
MKQKDVLGPFTLNYTHTEEYRIESGFHVDIPERDEDAFCFAMKDGVRVAIDDGAQRRTAKVLHGELFMVPAGCRCVVQSMAKHESRLLMIRFRRGMLVQQAGKSEPKAPYDELKLIVFRMPQVRNWVQDFVSDAGSDDHALYYQLQSHLYAMVSAMVSTIQNPKEPEEDLLEYVEQTRRYMQEQYHNPMDMEEIAALSGASASRFYQAFRSYTGLSPHKFMTKVRLDASLSVLAGSPPPIIEVAHSIGYADEYYFSRLFKKHMGMTPTEFAAAAQKKIVTLCRVFNGDLAALGITPTMSLRAAWTELLEQGLEEIASAQPDIILTGPISGEIYDALAAIAPTVILHWKRYSWKERFTEIGGLLGMSPVVERWLINYDMKVENARFHVRRRLGDEPLLLVSSRNHRYRVWGMKCLKMKDVFYDDLQIAPPAKVQDMTILETESLDEIAELECENVLFFVDEEESETYCRQLEKKWRTLNRSRERHLCLFIRYEEHLQYNASMHEALVEQTVRQLIELS